MTNTSSTWQAGGRSPVMPVDSPTVPKADAASNSAGVNEMSAAAMRTSAVLITRPTESRATVIA